MYPSGEVLYRAPNSQPMTLYTYGKISEPGLAKVRSLAKTTEPVDVSVGPTATAWTFQSSGIRKLKLDEASVLALADFIRSRAESIGLRKSGVSVTLMTGGRMGIDAPRTRWPDSWPRMPRDLFAVGIVWLPPSQIQEVQEWERQPPVYFDDTHVAAWATFHAEFPGDPAWLYPKGAVAPPKNRTAIWKD